MSSTSTFSLEGRRGGVFPGPPLVPATGGQQVLLPCGSFREPRRGVTASLCGGQPGEGRQLVQSPGPARPARSHDVGLAAVVLAGQVARGRAAGHAHHGELLGVAGAGAGVGAGARVPPQHGVCGPRAPGSGRRGRGPQPSGVGAGGREAWPLPSAGVAQSLYCWGLHTGEPPGSGHSFRAPARPCPLPTAPCAAPQPLTGHVHHAAAALPDHVPGLAGQATPRQTVGRGGAWAGAGGIQGPGGFRLEVGIQRGRAAVAPGRWQEAQLQGAG